MRDIDRAHRAIGEQADEILHQQFAGLRIQRRQRLVHQQDRRPHRQRAGDADALAHAAGQLFRIGAAKIRQARAAQRVIDHGARSLGAERGMHQRKFDVCFDRAPRQQRKILEHESQRVEAVGRRRAAQFGRPALGRSKPPRIDSSVLLPQPDGPDDRHHLARAHRERHVVEHVERAEAVADMVGDQVHVPCISVIARSQHARQSPLRHSGRRSDEAMRNRASRSQDWIASLRSQ